MTIRNARAEEMDTVRELFLEYSRMLGVDLCFQGFTQELETLPGKYAPPEGCLLLAMEGETAAGCVALRPVGDGVCEMKRLFVRPAFRGSGVGLQLAEAIIAQAERLRYREMVLDTLDHMLAARTLYSRLGFQETTPYYRNPLNGVIYMRRVLDAVEKHQERC